MVRKEIKISSENNLMNEINDVEGSDSGCKHLQRARDSSTLFQFQRQCQFQHSEDKVLMHPLARRQSKKLKVRHDASTPPIHAKSTANFSPRTVNPVASKSRSDLSPSLENPYSTSRGLRQFSMKVCEKVQEKGTTTYNEVADELVRELKLAEAVINAAAFSRDDAQESNDRKKSSKKKSDKKSNKTKQSHDDKNIRRRVYDALNVLMAMDIITKNKKEITWRGLPGTTSVHQNHLGDISGQSDYEGCRSNGLSQLQRMEQLQAEASKRQHDIQMKRDSLQELMVQNVCFQNLLGRNHAREMKEFRQDTYEIDGVKGSNDFKVKEGKNEKIPLPFIIINTDSTSVVQCEMCSERTNVSFDFSQPFEINDDNEILKRLGLNQVSREALERSLPPDLYHYCNSKGLLQTLVRTK